MSEKESISHELNSKDDINEKDSLDLLDKIDLEVDSDTNSENESDNSNLTDSIDNSISSLMKSKSKIDQDSNIQEDSTIKSKNYTNNDDLTNDNLEFNTGIPKSISNIVTDNLGDKNYYEFKKYNTESFEDVDENKDKKNSKYKNDQNKLKKTIDKSTTSNKDLTNTPDYDIDYQILK